MSNSIMTVPVLAAVSNRTQEAAVLLLALHHLLRLEKHFPHPVCPIAHANRFICLDRRHQRVESHLRCEDDAAEKHCSNDVGSLFYQPIIQSPDIILVRLRRGTDTSDSQGRRRNIQPTARRDTA